jgi:hypothetical protein
MKINYSKIELIPINMDENEIAPFKDVFECALGQFPIKYLGIPLHDGKLRKEDIQPLIHKILKISGGVDFYPMLQESC